LKEKAMTFATELKKYAPVLQENFWDRFTPQHVQTALGKNFLTVDDYAALLSPAAAPFLETMAQKAHALTLQHFGKTILFFSPMYLSNFCTNACRYCGFNAHNRIPRKQMTLPEVEAEARALAQTGIRHVLILTGDAPAKAGVDYLVDCLSVLKKRFLSIGIEIYALDQEEYARLIRAGVDQMTMFQETYDPAVYARVHPQGPKQNFTYRLDAPERVAAAGVRAVNLGALLGLIPWRNDAFFTGLHAHWLQNRFPALEVSLSAPRLRPHAGDFSELHPVDDAALVQYLLAARLFMPRLGLTLSTRENAELRNHLLPLGITRISAGTSTAVAGHTQPEAGVGQFEISDSRSVAEMQAAITAAGYQPIFTDWHAI
jgi:2-iminoacetate synthase